MKLVKYCLVGLIALSTLLVPVSVTAVDYIMTDAHITRIRSNCQEALGAIATIHANDAPIFVNRNQTYFSIGDKMMSRLNGRLSADRFDASEQVRITTEYDNVLHKFRTTYKTYDDTMAELLRMDCKKQPVSFFDMVAEAREQRASVNQSVKKLNELIDNYQESVLSLQSQQADRLKKGSS